MKIILKEDVDNLGYMGAIVNVAPGYARNYLIPKKFALEASNKNIKALEHEKRIIQEKVNKLKVKCEDVATRMSSLTITLKAKAGTEGKLFGSITNKDIAERLIAEGFEVDKKRIVLDQPIKRIGEHTVQVKLHQQVEANIKVQVEEEE